MWYPLLILLNACFLFLTDPPSGPVSQKPNIIYLFTDQQHSSMMSCAGNAWLKTPAMDYIAKNGTRFTRAYTTNPVCSPARISLMTGRMPGLFSDKAGNQVLENVGAMKISEIPEEVQRTTLAAWLKKAGYSLIFGGKEHLPAPLTPNALGFEDISNDEREQLAESAARYIKARPANPYFMVVSLINPHDICYMAIRDFAETDHEKRLISTGGQEIRTLDRAMKRPDGISEKDFYEHHCPPLPPNYEPQQGEPKAIKSLLDSKNFRKQAREKYSDQDWRLHRWAYCRLTETVDEQVQTILNAVRESGQEENTIIIFSSDHGDMDGSHRMEHKSVLYEESANIPFMVMWKGHLQTGVTDSTHLVSNGLDLLPTVCDFAGIQGKADPRGKSLRPLLEGKKVVWRKTLGVESEVGRMVVDSDRYKYIQYVSNGEMEEQLLDLNKDPYEKTHFTKDPGYKKKLLELKGSFEKEWFTKN
ncbi:sulfatase family protein [Telluribacter sp.]|jgi:choline-sulfatase|uniref:sulfatase family protein n=1 Tax=Telluribacter sp. TaxID=1978767 RepID=UPI002E1435DC|nr:sulfatase-like hydrolase/transferase [Telluribacter sp.]